MNRRAFLGQIALWSAFSLCRPGQLWATPTRPGDHPLQRVIVIFLRGAVDGLNVVIPYQDENYHEARPTIAIPEPGTPLGALKLDDQFALHPALAPLLPFWQEKSLAFVQAAGSPDGTRSHFSAQAAMESGLGGSSAGVDGWMNRLLGELPAPQYPTRAVSFGASTLPLILSGSTPVASQPFGPATEKTQPSEMPEVAAVFDRLYSGNDILSANYREGKAAHQRLLADLRQDMTAADKDAPPAASFANETRQVAKMICGESQVQLAFIALGGWDTHIAQGAANGNLANRLRPLGAGLAQLIKGLGNDYARTTLVVMSEFGRTVSENGNGGTDHGHGNVMWVMGGGIHGGKIYGKWPGLNKEALYEKRDLAVTTDYRDVLWQLLKHRLNPSEASLSRVFPGFSPSRDILSGLFA